MRENGRYKKGRGGRKMGRGKHEEKKRKKWESEGRERKGGLAPPSQNPRSATAKMPCLQ